MSDLQHSLDQARRRLAAAPSPARRSDRGRLRLPRPVLDKLRELLLGQERPAMVEVRRELEAWCRRARQRPPSRATLYHVLPLLEGHAYVIDALPPAVQQVLYNLDPAGMISGRQLAFYGFNYGGLEVLSFAAGLPWLDLYQAARLAGWRPRSRGPLEAVLRARRIA